MCSFVGCRRGGALAKWVTVSSSAPAATDFKELQGFLGSVNWFRKHIINLLGSLPLLLPLSYLTLTSPYPYPYPYLPLPLPLPCPYPYSTPSVTLTSVCSTRILTKRFGISLRVARYHRELLGDSTLRGASLLSCRGPQD